MERSPSQVAPLNGTGGREFSNKLVCLLECSEIPAPGLASYDEPQSTRRRLFRQSNGLGSASAVPG